MRGEAAYLFVFDTGGRIDLDRARELVRESQTLPVVEVAKAAPKYVSLPRPLLVRFPELKIHTTLGPLEMTASAKFYEVGALSLVFRVPFDEPGTADLGKYERLRVLEGGKELGLGEYAGALYARIRKSLQPAILDAYDVPAVPEEYTVYCITEHELPVLQLMREPLQRAKLAALLANEPRADKLAPKEVDDNLRYWYSYYEDDLVVVDWDNALIVDPSGKYEDVLYVMELANLQLLELRVYDQYLDRILLKAYRDLERFYRGRSLLESAEPVLKELADARIDLTRMTDLVENIGKLFGDYYLAKVYLSLNERFHIAKWQSIVEKKIRTLNDLYLMASEELQARRNLTVELMIVLLFVIDLIIIAIPFVSVR